MRKHLAIVCATIVSVALLVVGCGGSTPLKQHTYTTKVQGHKVTQVHSASLAVPKPGTKLPASLAPIAAPPKVRAVAHARHTAPVAHVAKVIPAHRAARAPPHPAGDVTVTTVEQFDSVTTSTIPSWAHYVAGYVNGNYQTYWRMLGHYPVVVGISVHQNHQDGGADCIDLEPGNPGPDAAVPWVEWQLTQHNPHPCIYSMLSWMPQIKANLAGAGLKQCSTTVTFHCFMLWDANWTYVRHVDVGYNCTQWTDKAYGLNLDESTCLTSFYGKPQPPPDPYALLSKTTFVLYGEKAREYYTVKTWYDHGCKTPARRSVCVSTRRHLIWLRDRLWRVTHPTDHICISVSTCAPPDWKFAHRGARLQLLEKPIGSWTAKR